MFVVNFLLVALEAQLFSLCAPQVKNVLLLDALQLLLLLAGIVKNLKSTLLSLIIFYEGSFFILKY
jgi:hypothetical protein